VSFFLRQHNNDVGQKHYRGTERTTYDEPSVYITDVSYMGSHQIQKLTKFEPSNGQPNPQMDPKRYPKIGPKADPNTDPNTRSKKKITDPKT